jgi:chemotaxis protein MotB
MASKGGSSAKKVPHHHDDHDDGHHEGGGHGEPWLVSYADLMTLLFGFFVILYSLATAKLQDEEAMVRMRKEVAIYFGGEYVTPMSAVVQDFKQKIGGTIPDRSIQTKLFPEGFEVVLQSNALFDSGSASLKPPAEGAIKHLIASISKLGGQNFTVSVEGHTDDVPIRTRQFPSNWELSAARASTVIRMFESSGFAAERLTAVGYGDSRPAVPNRGKDKKAIASNQAKNRRVKIRVLQLDTAPETAKAEGKKAMQKK